MLPKNLPIFFCNFICYFFMASRSVSSIVCSTSFTVSINYDQNAVSFGKSYFSSNGNDGDKELFPKIIPSVKHIISISTSENHYACLDNDGNVFTFGLNGDGKLGIGDTGLLETCIPQKVNLPPCTQTSCGYYFTMCLSENGEVYSFGYNEDGQLGLGNNEERYYSPQLISSLKDVEFIECGENYTFCKTLNNEIFCWGCNYHGQLGLENTDNQNTPILCSS